VTFPAVMATASMLGDANGLATAWDGVRGLVSRANRFEGSLCDHSFCFHHLSKSFCS
jgi:hypothetical protein